MKNLIRDIKENYKLVLGVLIGGLFLGWLFFHPSGAERAPEIQLENHQGHDQSSEVPTIWTCSMHPQIKQDKPGQCPICAMDLIPLATAKSTGEVLNTNEIVLSESAAKLADIQTMEVTRGMPQKTMYLQGKVQADERNMAELTARFGGRIEKLFVNFAGQPVRLGEKLATIYSPDLITAQRELLEAASFKENRPAFYTAAKAKLKLWDLSDDQIAAIEEEGEPQLYFDVLSPISGTVMKRHVALGDYVNEGSPLFQVTDLGKVWVLFDAYESDLPWIKTGDHVAITIPSVPGKDFDGMVAFIDPFIDPKTRIARVRIELPNTGLSLKPEMFARGVLYSNIAALSDHLLIPKSSILWTGKRAVVYVKVPERELPSFVYREITLGPEAGDFYVVADGLTEGESIAVNGVFKIDAASQLEGLPSMMTPDQQVTGANAAFKKQLQAVYDSYIFMNEAFVASDPKEVRKTAAKVKSSLQDVDMALLDGEAHMVWMKHLKSMETEIRAISSEPDISAQRIAFAAFNDAFYAALKAFGLQHGTVYYQYCPMANGDKGAYWLSDIEDIENPYFGDQMLKCGETRETLDFGKK